MNIKMLFSHEENADGKKHLYLAGTSYDMPEDLARRLIKDGRAEPIGKPSAGNTNNGISALK